MQKKESPKETPEQSKMSPLFEEAARVLSNIAVENIFLTKDELRKKLDEDFKDLTEEEKNRLLKLFSKKEEGHG